MPSTTLLSKIFGTRNQRYIKRMSKVVHKINQLEPEMQSLSDEELSHKTAVFKQRFQGGESLDSLLPEAFAVVREASVRTLGLRHFDVQLIGGIVLHSGKIAEMRTGEGKTLAATLAAYLNALTGRGVDIITVNDYLVKRDAAWMLPIYQFLGLTVGVNIPSSNQQEKREAYAADITYGTNNEFGFDYLRDNMAFSPEVRVQRGLHYAIVDEVDSILIDEARTPLIISGSAEQGSDLYLKMNQLAPQLTKQEVEGGEGDYTVDEKTRQVFLTEAGHAQVEKLLIEAGLLETGASLYDISHIALIHHLYAALRAHALYRRDVDYILKDNEVVIVDEHTGRLMVGRRWSDGLHQAVEAKEGVPIKSENQTLASITFQNFFRMYQKLAGMTGTADTEAYEFQQIYGLEVVVIPTNKSVIRQDLPDQVFLTTNAKYQAILTDIKARIARGQPILVGTTSIESSEYLSDLLTKEQIAHQVLNAKFHEKEAKIIAQAGRPGVVTIATNMAGRGTDIVLGGNVNADLAELEDSAPEITQGVKTEWEQRHAQIVSAGGLHVLGTERNEARRIDNQLRGRSGRQGDPGSSQFYLSLEDNLMRIFAPERMGIIMRKLGMQEHEAIENALITRAIENAQRKVEGHNFDIRKQLLEYDDVSNDQRKIIYQQRDELMATNDISDTITIIRHDVIHAVVDEHIPPQSLEEQWDVAGLERQLEQEFTLKLALRSWMEQDEALHEESLRQRIVAAVTAAVQKKEEMIGTHAMRQLEKSIMLQSVDLHWREHLSAMDQLRRGIHLRGYAQKNPKQEYKREAFLMFTELLNNIKRDVIAKLSSVQVQEPTEAIILEEQRRKQSEMGNLQFLHPEISRVEQAMGDSVDQEEMLAQAALSPAPVGESFVRTQPKVGRNDLCPCGSGKKYKHCHGALK